jgi:hypothetical protein
VATLKMATALGGSLPLVLMTEKIGFAKIQHR